MPPPMHIVTTINFSPRRLPSIRAALFVFPRGAVSVRDNERGNNVDLEGIAPERSDVLAKYTRQHLQQKSSTRTAQVIGGGASCDISDAACQCPDCSFDPTDGATLTLSFFAGPHGAAVNAYYSCSVVSPPDFYNNDVTAYQACLASTGIGPSDFINLSNPIRQNARDYAWYAFNAVTVLSTQTNPVKFGAITYSYTYQGLIDESYSGGGSLVGDSPSADFIEVAIYPTKSGAFSRTRLAYWGPPVTIGPVGGSLASLARIVFASYYLGT